MAKQAKKSNTKTSTKKKVTSKKITKKRKPTKAQRKRRVKRNIIITLSLLGTLLLIGFGYYLGNRGVDDLNPFEEIVEEGYTTKDLLNDLAKIQTKTPTMTVTPKDVAKAVKEDKPTRTIKIKKPIEHKKPTVVIKKLPPRIIVSPIPSLVPKVSTSPKLKPKIEEKIIVSVPKKRKPKLVIIIDDVSKKSHISAIKATHMNITPSIFPPYTLAKHSNVLATGLKHYMIHLPMESGNRQFNTQSKTLMTYFSRKQMQERAKELRVLFPHAKYVNNHTGSVFTANYTAMKKLYSALKKEGFLFLDSRTIGNSTVRKICREFGDKYISRDIFIDNIHTKVSIRNQLKKAVRLAKKRGYAVAIGHPHPLTIEAIASAKDILKDVELVYIDALYTYMTRRK